MKKNILLSSILIVSTIITLNSCKKKTEVDNETQTVVDNALCEQQFISVAPVVNQKGSGSPKQQGFRVNNCGTGTWISPSDTAIDALGAYTFSVIPTFTLDYSSNTCSDNDNITKNGKLYITSTHKWTAIKTLTTSITHTTTIVFDNYTADGVKYEGTVTLIKTGNTVRTIVSNGHCTNAAGSWNIYYNADKTSELLADGSVKVWGTSSGTNREGRGFSTSTSQSNPIVKKPTCKWISSGVIDVTPEGFKVRTVDFGNGDCDNKATYTVNGQTIEFNLN
jgi:hypothetical protein